MLVKGGTGLALSGLASFCVAQNKPPPYMLMTISKVIAIGLYNVIHVQSVEYILYLIKILWYVDICKKIKTDKSKPGKTQSEAATR